MCENVKNGYREFDHSGTLKILREDDPLILSGKLFHKLGVM